jgi:SAM domain (Sterile alpha motif)
MAATIAEHETPLARWLAEQGLGHHAKAFADNGIDRDFLRDLTDADLKEPWSNLGDRKRPLKAGARGRSATSHLHQS